MELIGAPGGRGHGRLEGRRGIAGLTKSRSRGLCGAFGAGSAICQVSTGHGIGEERENEREKETWERWKEA
eukprot:1497189-Rhodomonas_salina.1